LRSIHSRRGPRFAKRTAHAGATNWWRAWEAERASNWTWASCEAANGVGRRQRSAGPERASAGCQQADLPHGAAWN
jgi:hypothetical protein